MIHEVKKFRRCIPGCLSLPLQIIGEILLSGQGASECHLVVVQRWTLLHGLQHHAISKAPTLTSLHPDLLCMILDEYVHCSCYSFTSIFSIVITLYCLIFLLVLSILSIAWWCLYRTWYLYLYNMVINHITQIQIYHIGLFLSSLRFQDKTDWIAFDELHYARKWWSKINRALLTWETVWQHLILWVVP